jgi:hypothetical protein
MAIRDATWQSGNHLSNLPENAPGEVGGFSSAYTLQPRSSCEVEAGRYVGPRKALSSVRFFQGNVRYLTAMTSTVRMSGSRANKSAPTCANARGISPLRCASRAPSDSKVSKMP